MSSYPKPPKPPTGIKSPFASVQQQPTGHNAVFHNPENYNLLINSAGVTLIHAKPLPCPRMLDITSGDHDPACNECYNGMIYYGYKEFTGSMMGNDNQRQFNMNGTWDISNCQVVIPTKYDDGSDMDVQIYDRIIVKDFTVRYYQRAEYSQTGINRLHFPAVAIDRVIDYQYQEYHEGVDVEITPEGYMKWISDRRPGYNIDIERGVIFAVNYYAKATLTILSLPHQLRVTKTIDPGTGSVIQARFPQLAVCRKEFIPFDPNDKVGAPDAPSPRDGSFSE